MSRPWAEQDPATANQTCSMRFHVSIEKNKLQSKNQVADFIFNTESICGKRGQIK